MELIIVMGVTWTIEFISEYVDNKIIQLLLDICNLYRGVLIFLIFVCKRRILVEIVRRIGKLDNSNFSRDILGLQIFIQFFSYQKRFLQVRMNQGRQFRWPHWIWKIQLVRVMSSYQMADRFWLMFTQIRAVNAFGKQAIV